MPAPRPTKLFVTSVAHTGILIPVSSVFAVVYCNIAILQYCNNTVVLFGLVQRVCVRTTRLGKIRHPSVISPYCNMKCERKNRDTLNKTPEDDLVLQYCNIAIGVAIFFYCNIAILLSGETRRLCGCQLN